MPVLRWLVEQGAPMGSEEEMGEALYCSGSDGDHVRLMARDVVGYSDEEEVWLWGLAEAAAQGA